MGLSLTLGISTDTLHLLLTLYCCILSQHVYGDQNQFVWFSALSVGKSMSTTPTVPDFFKLIIDNQE